MAAPAVSCLYPTEGSAPCVTKPPVLALYPADFPVAKQPTRLTTSISRDHLPDFVAQHLSDVRIIIRQYGHDVIVVEIDVHPRPNPRKSGAVADHPRIAH